MKLAKFCNWLLAYVCYLDTKMAFKYLQRQKLFLFKSSYVYMKSSKENFEHFRRFSSHSCLKLTENISFLNTDPMVQNVPNCTPYLEEKDEK